MSSLVLTCLSACGGGGSSAEGSGSTGSTPAASATVSGAAAKGLLLDAIVTFYPVSNGVAGQTALASVRTNSSTGAFSSPVTSAGPVVATLTTDSSTQMLDELSGTAIVAPSGLTLHTVIDGVTDLQPITITPLTEMAYDLASAASGGLTTTNIDAANGAVSTTLLGGASILYTQPIDIKNYASATVAQQEQAKLLTALAVAASEGTATGVNGAACSGTYSENLTCMVGGLGKLITMNSSGKAMLGASAAYVADAYQVIDSEAVTVDGGHAPSVLGLNAPTAAETSFVTDVQTQQPIPGYGASANPLTNTKDLFANIRTNILDQSTTQTFGYSQTLNALTTDFHNNVSPIVGNTASLLGAAYRAAEIISSGIPTYQGSCGYDPTGLNTPTNVALCRFGNGYLGQILLTVTQTSPTTYSLVTQDLTYPTPGQTVTSNSVNAGLVVNTTFPALTAKFTLSNGSQSDPTPASASLSGPYYVNGTGGQVTGNLNAAESSNWDKTTHSGSLSLSGTLSGGAGGVSLVNATIGSDTVITVQNIPLRSTATTVSSAPPISLSGVVDLKQYITAAFAYAAKVVINTPVFDASGTLGVPSSVVVTGSIDQVSPGGNIPLFNGKVSVITHGVPQFNATEPLSASNTLTVQAQVAGTLSLSGGRILSVSATANASELIPTPASPDSFSATYSYTTPAGTATLNATGQYDKTHGLTGTITNNAGVTISVAYPIGGPLTGTVTAGGKETATINGAFIYYSDGTSESLF